jgi:hypothetical protein
MWRTGCILEKPGLDSRWDAWNINSFNKK